MDNTSFETYSKLMEINEKISSKYKILDKEEKNVLENLKSSDALIFRHMSKLMETDLKVISKGKPMIGVDGSINTVGSSYPHYISVMQALAKCTDRACEDIKISDIHTPLLEEEYHFIDKKISPQDMDEKIKAAKMAKLELEAAIKAIEMMDASIIMMDGSLIRYKINCGSRWDDFVYLALQKDILVIGVIEEIKTRELSKLLNIEGLANVYDREILFGFLEEGEMIVLKEIKEDRGLKKCFMRTSKDPHVIGMDVLEEQADLINELADLVYTHTSDGGRGIPLWLDIVDNEVKISNKYVDALIETYIDPAIRKRLFIAKRDNRNL